MIMPKELDDLKLGEITVLDASTFNFSDFADLIMWRRTTAFENLTSITVKNNRQLSSHLYDLIKALEKHKNLRMFCINNLDVGNETSNWENNYTELLLTCPNLTVLDLTGTKINASHIASFVNLLKNTKTLTTLNLSNNQLKDEEADQLIEALERNNTLQQLDLSGNQISRKKLETIESILAKKRKIADTLLDLSNAQITQIDLSGQQMTNEEVKSLSLGLVKNIKLTHLDLSNNKISDEGVEYILTALEKNNTLLRLDLSGNQISSGLIMRVKLKLEKNLEIAVQGFGYCQDKISNFNNTGIDNEQVAIISNGLEQNKNLVELHLENNQITDVGARHLITALEKNDCIEKINLSGNKISADNLEKINVLLLRNQKFARLNINKLGNIASLDLSNNNHNDEDVKIIVKGLGQNNTLITLDLSNNQITDTGAELIINELKQNKTLLTLNLSGNKISDENLKLIEQDLHRNRYLAEFKKIEEAYPMKIQNNMNTWVYGSLCNPLAGGCGYTVSKNDHSLFERISWRSPKLSGSSENGFL